MMLYGCHSAVIGRPHPGAVYRVQTGWTTDGRRAMEEIITLPSIARCGYDIPHKDPRCAHCAHAGAQPAVAM